MARTARKQIAGAGRDIHFCPEWQFNKGRHLQALHLDWQQTKDAYPNAVLQGRAVLMSATDDPSHFSVDNLVSVISERLYQLGYPRPVRPTSKAKHDGTLETILANAVQVVGCPDTWVAHYLKRGQYVGRGQTGMFSQDTKKDLVDCMAKAGYLEVVKSNGKASQGAGLCSKFRPTERLAFLFDMYFLHTGLIDYVKGPIVLKDANKKPVPLPDNTPGQLIANAQAIADYVASHEVRLIDDRGEDITHNILWELIELGKIGKLEDRKGYLETHCVLDGFIHDTARTDILARGLAQRTRTYRVFNEEFWLGGRFYGHWLQSVPSHLRKYATINGNRTVALDFSSLHIYICYAKKGIRPQKGDLYKLNVRGFNRDIAKKVCLIAINARDRGAAFGALKAESDDRGWNLTPYQINRYIDAFAKKHEPISDYFFSGSGTAAQFIDSQIAQHILLNLMGQSVPCIPIHDGFIVEEQHEDKLADAMDDACLDILDVVIPHSREH